jgi:methionyl aminopeptidase
MSLPEDVLEKYRRAGAIAREVREDMKQSVREGAPIIEVCEKAEGLIRQKGGHPAFPCNVSVNEIAAHYSSPPNDKHVIPPNSLVKVDIGVHLDGYIADTAVTVCFCPELENLVRTAESALETAIKTIRAEISTSKLGSAIQKTIQAYGCKPISNLTGHQVGRFLIHTGKSIPNVSHLMGAKIRRGDVLAIEPFVTVVKATGKVKDGRDKTIFRFVKRKSIEDPCAKRLLNHIEVNFRTLPFSERWLKDIVPAENHSSAFRELLHSRCVISYPVFIEASGNPVAQAEHTVLVQENGCEVLT